MTGLQTFADPFWSAVVAVLALIWIGFRLAGGVATPPPLLPGPAQARVTPPPLCVETRPLPTLGGMSTEDLLSACERRDGK